MTDLFFDLSSKTNDINEPPKKIHKIATRTSNTNCVRLQRVYDATTIYVWSIKLQKLMICSKDDFEGRILRCQLCIPRYKVGFTLTDKPPRKECKATFVSLYKLINHVLPLEDAFRCELLWADRSEVPNDLRRERELGDLTNIEAEPILRVEFISITLVNYQTVLRKYFRMFGCPCKNHISGDKCPVKIGSSNLNMLSHFSSLEKEYKKFFLFKANLQDLIPNDVNFQRCTMNIIRKRGRPTATITSTSGLNNNSFGTKISSFDDRINAKIDKQLETLRANQQFCNNRSQLGMSSMNSILNSTINTTPISNQSIYSSVSDILSGLKQQSQSAVQSSTSVSKSIEQPAVKRRRGRPPKKKLIDSPGMPSSELIERKIVQIIYQGKPMSVELFDTYSSKPKDCKDDKIQFVFNDGIVITEIDQPVIARSDDVIISNEANKLYDNLMETVRKVTDQQCIILD